MSIVTALTDLLIRPLEIVFEVFFSLVFRFVRNQGLTIFFLSLAVNILVMPLYQKADAMQEEARKTEEKLSYWTKHIKKHFKGDERFMILQTYYRQNHYKPTDALRGSVSLLLEIPFFMAAYRFLSGLEMLKGVSFGPIADLGAPDGMLVIAGVAINVLPILMTAVNLISGYIYTKGSPLKSKIQLYGMALIFMILLYGSPAGLVFYWTLNNVFSLVKNILYKVVKPELVMPGLCTAVSIPPLLYILFGHSFTHWYDQLIAVLVMLIFSLPLASQLFKGKRTHRMGKAETVHGDFKMFALGCLFLTVLVGGLIPSTLIANSPAEFVDTVLLENPVKYVIRAGMISAGVFLVWPGIFYMLAGTGGKKAMELGAWILSGTAVADYMFFGKNYGNLSPNMKFDALPVPETSEILINLLVLIVLAAVLILIWRKKKELVRVGYIAAILAVAVMSAVHVPKIYRAANSEIQYLKYFEIEEPRIKLNREGKNVVIIMMDRAIGLNVPYIFQERPALLEQFDGFTYYPNTVSHGRNTNIGAPGLTGGYEYTPDKMNMDTERTLEEKHDEALKVLPVMFDREGYDVTVYDAPNLGYNVITPPESVFEDYPEIRVQRMMAYFSDRGITSSQRNQDSRIRNLFCYSVFKSIPVLLQSGFYAEGSYNAPDQWYAEYLAEGSDESIQDGQILQGISKASGYPAHSYMEAFRALQALPELTDVTDDGSNTFLFMANDVSHGAAMLKEPEYEPALIVENSEYDEMHWDRFNYQGYEMKVENELQMANYHSNMTYMIQLGKWLDYLKAQDVYDNTRIIIAADHGRAVFHFDSMAFDRGESDVLNFNPVLLVKDFNTRHELETDKTFMTNADVPSIAIDGLLQDKKNPFTGNEISSDAKKNPQLILNSRENCGENNTESYLPGDWYEVTEEMYKWENWKLVGKHSVLPYQ